MAKVISKITIILYLSLAGFPLMKANFNSIFIILCSVFAIYDFIKNKKKIVFNTKLFFLTSVFWFFLLYEIISLDFNSKTILLHLPFLIFPLLFIFKPDYINNKVKEYSLLVFQVSVVCQTIIYLIVFLKKFNIRQIFHINNYNIPLFRTYVLENTFVEIHPTYFSAFLLFSFTISLFFELKRTSPKHLILHLTNIFFTSFFILVFISKIIIITFVFTLFIFFLFKFKNLKRKKLALIIFSLSAFLLIFSFSRPLKERFNEIRTEINKPLVGDYHNSVNIRVVIIKCSFNLLKKLPLFGYGQDLQKELNYCYKNKNNSNFYTLATYNTHNYYFNLILYGGWLFLLLFLLYFYYLFSKENYPLFIVIFIIQILIINVTENFFSRHHGTVLFIYFISLFLTPKKMLKNYT